MLKIPLTLGNAYDIMQRSIETAAQRGFKMLMHAVFGEIEKQEVTHVRNS